MIEKITLKDSNNGNVAYPYTIDELVLRTGGTNIKNTLDSVEDFIDDTNIRINTLNRTLNTEIAERITADQQTVFKDDIQDISHVNEPMTDDDKPISAHAVGLVKQYVDSKVAETIITPTNGSIVADDTTIVSNETSTDVYTFSVKNNVFTPVHDHTSLVNDVNDKAGTYEYNPEFYKVIVDTNNKVVFGIRIDGTVYIPELSNNNYNDKISFIEDHIDELNSTIGSESPLSCFEFIDNPEYVKVVLDADNKILMGIKVDGTVYIPGLEKQNSEEYEEDESGSHSEYITEMEDPEERLEITVDAEQKVLSYRDKDGVLHEEVGIALNNEGLTDLEQALKDHGFETKAPVDWSDAESLMLAEPRCAALNLITDANLMNLSKISRVDGEEGVNFDVPVEVEFWDMQGNYFKKYALISGQGNSSMVYPKKNIAIDFYNEDPTSEDFDDDNSFKIKFGNWAAFDSFHLKSFYTDFLRGAATVAYQVADLVECQRGILEDRPWKKALLGKYTISDDILENDEINNMSLQIDNGAICHPEGFPCIVYQNGQFWGIFSFNIKKHRDNYQMKSSNPNHIHLDGELTSSALWKPSSGVDWSAFEIRNPKKLVYAAGVFNVYNSATGYTAGAIVCDAARKKVYMAKVANSNKELTNTTYWRQISDSIYKYNADVLQAEIAGNSDGSTSYSSWEAGNYNIGDIVEYNGHKFMNTVANNSATPIYHAKNNADDAPDFKNKTGCGWINVTNTIKVKEAIIKLSTRVTEIDALSTADAKREYIETYFDVNNLIDYEIVQQILSDSDGTSKNWQWITYDGLKWWCCEYDKDMSFGNIFHGQYYRPARRTNEWIYSSNTILNRIITYYGSTIKSYGLQLIQNVATKKVIIGLLKDWVDRIGQSNFEKEWEKWPESPCNRNPYINTDYWQRTNNIVSDAYSSSKTYSAGDYVEYTDIVQREIGGATRTVWEYHVYKSAQNNNVGHNPLTDNGTWWIEYSYNPEKTYNPTSANDVDKECYYGNGSRMYKFICKAETVGNAPITQFYTYNPTYMGYRDSFWRFVKFVDEKIDILSEFYAS